MTPSRALLAALLAGALLTPACSDDPVRTSAPPVEDESYDISLVALIRPVNGIFARSNDDIYAVSGVLLHRDSDRWQPLPWPGNLNRASDVWTLANGGIVLRDFGWIYLFNGTTWDYLRVPYGSNTVCGLPSGEIYAAGPPGEISFYDGNIWHTEVVGEGSIQAIDALSREQVHAIAYPADHVWRQDGAWQGSDIPGILELVGVTCDPDGSAYLLGRLDNDAEIIHAGNDGSYTTVAKPLPFYPEHLATDDSYLYVAGRQNFSGGLVFRRDKQGQWEELSVGNRPVRGMTPGTSGDLIVRKDRDLSISDPTRSLTLLDWTDMWANAIWQSPEGDVVVAGYEVRLVRDGAWIELPRPDYYYEEIVALDGASSSDFYGVGRNMIAHYQNGVWTWEGSGFGSALLDVCIQGHDRLVVGSHGRIMRYEGSSWVQENTGTTQHLNGVDIADGIAIAVGDNGTILRRTGDAWRPDDCPVTWHLRDVHVFRRNRAIAVGSNGANVLLFDGEKWRVHPVESSAPASSSSFVSIWGSSPDDYYAIQHGGAVHHFRAGVWALLPRVMGDVDAVTGTPDGDIILQNNYAILRYHRR